MFNNVSYHSMKQKTIVHAQLWLSIPDGKRTLWQMLTCEEGLVCVWCGKGHTDTGTQAKRGHTTTSAAPGPQIEGCPFSIQQVLQMGIINSLPLLVKIVNGK